MSLKSRQRVLKRKMGEYVNSFTVHGLSRIVSGNKIERTIWTTAVLLAMMCAVYVIQGYIVKYFEHETYVEVTTVTTKRAYYPSVTFCLDKYKEKMDQLYCGKPLFRLDSVKPCTRKNQGCLFPTVKRNTAIWSNGLFNVMIDDSSSSESQFTSHSRSNDICVTWHQNKTLYQTYSGIEIQFLVAEKLFGSFSPEVSITVHEQDVYPDFLVPQLKILPNKTYHLKLVKTESKRLPYPFRSNCVNKTPHQYFTGAYNRRTCLILNHDVDIYKKYGTARDISLQYIPQEIQNNYKTNISVNKFYEEYFKPENSIDWLNEKCPLSCHDVDYEVTAYVSTLTSQLKQAHQFDTKLRISNKTCFPLFFNDEEIARFKQYAVNDEEIVRFKHYAVNIEYQNPEIYRLIEEKELYAWDKMLGELGGFLGLVIGASILSLVEIIVFIAMAILKKLS